MGGRLPTHASHKSLSLSVQNTRDECRYRPSGISTISRLPKLRPNAFHPHYPHFVALSRTLRSIDQGRPAPTQIVHRYCHLTGKRTVVALATRRSQYGSGGAGRWGRSSCDAQLLVGYYCGVARKEEHFGGLGESSGRDFRGDTFHVRSRARRQCKYPCYCFGIDTELSGRSVPTSRPLDPLCPTRRWPIPCSPLCSSYPSYGRQSRSTDPDPLDRSGRQEGMDRGSGH